MNIGLIEAKNLMVGSTQVDKICLGTEKVWPTGGGVPDFSVKITWMDDSVTVDTYPDGEIPGYQYQGQTDIASVEIGEGITRIGEYCFCDIYCNFTACTLPSTLQYIEGQVFQHAGVREWHIPASVLEIGMNAFNTTEGSCTPDAIYFEGTTPPTLTDDMEQLTLGANCPIYVPCETEGYYRQEYSNYSSRISCY